MMIRSLKHHHRLAFFEVFTLIFLLSFTVLVADVVVDVVVVDAWVVISSSSVALRSIPSSSSSLALRSSWTSSGTNRRSGKIRTTDADLGTRRCHHRHHRRRGNNGGVSNTVLWDAYEDQYAAYLHSSMHQPQQQQQQEEQEAQQHQQQQDMINQHNEFQQFSTSSSPSSSQQNESVLLQTPPPPPQSSSSSSSSSYPEPAYSSSIFGSGSGSGVGGSYLDNLNIQQQQPEVQQAQQMQDMTLPMPLPLPLQQQDMIPPTSSSTTAGGVDKKADQEPVYQDISTPSFSFADLAESSTIGRSSSSAAAKATSSFTFMDTVSTDAALLADQLSKTQSELEKIEQEIKSVTLSLLNDDLDVATTTTTIASAESPSSSGGSFINNQDPSSEPEIAPPANNRPSFAIIPPSSPPPDPMTSNDAASASTSTRTSVGFTYSDGISPAPEASIAVKDEAVVTKPNSIAGTDKDRRFRDLEEYERPTSTTLVTVEIEQMFPTGTDIMKLKDAWLDFVWTNGGGIMIPKKKMQSTMQPKRQQQYDDNDDNGINNINVREFWMPFGLKQELVSVDSQNSDEGTQVSIVYRTTRRGPFFQDIVLGSHVGTVVFDTSTEGTIVGPKMTWTVEFDVDENPPPTDWDKISQRLNQKTSMSLNDYLIMSSRLVSTTTTKLTTKSSFWESWTASQLAVATQNFVAYVEDEYGYLLTFTVEETMPTGFSPIDVMDAWAQHCWKGGGGISLGNFASIDNEDGGKDFNKIFSIIPGTIVPPLVFQKQGKKQRWVIPSLLEEEIVSDDLSVRSKDGKISYKVTNPNLFTYPVHFHRGDVEFNHVGGVRGSSIEGYSTEECTKIVWTVTVRPYRKFLGGGVKFWTKYNMRWSLRNLKLLLEDQKEAKRSSMDRRLNTRRTENSSAVEHSQQNTGQQQDVGRNFPRIQKFDRGSSSSPLSPTDVPGTRPTFTIRRPNNTPDDENSSNNNSSTSDRRSPWGRR